MAFLIFEEVAFDDRPVLRPTGESFKLAGRNLLYKTWEKRGKLLNAGWQVRRDELIQLHFSPSPPRGGARLIIDFHPTATGIGLIEPIEIYAYTFGKNGIAEWTPLMLELQDVFYKEYERTISAEQKAEILKTISYHFEGEESIEF